MSVEQIWRTEGALRLAHPWQRLLSTLNVSTHCKTTQHNNNTKHDCICHSQFLNLAQLSNARWQCCQLVFVQAQSAEVFQQAEGGRQGGEAVLVQRKRVHLGEVSKDVWQARQLCLL